MITGLSQSEISTVNAMWTLIRQADVKVQKELYARLRDSHKEKSSINKKHSGIDYIKSLAVGKGKVPAWEDGKGALVDVKYNV